MPLVIIDLDGTLLQGSTSSEKLFFRFLLDQGLIGLPQVRAWLWFYARWLPVYGSVTAKKNKAYLAGLRCDRIEAAAAEFVRTQLISRYNREMVRRINTHQARGDVTLLVTGSLEVIGRPVCSSLGIPHLRATRCAMDKGTFTRKPPMSHPFGREKIRLSREVGQQLGYDLSTAVAYGNDRFDIALLSEVSRPVAVEPDRMLRRHALRYAWEIIEATV